MLNNSSKKIYLLIKRLSKPMTLPTHLLTKRLSYSNVTLS